MNISKVSAVCVALFFASCHCSYALKTDDGFDKLINQKAEELIKNLDYDYGEYPWLAFEKFADTPEKIAKIVIKKVISDEIDWLDKVPESPADKNYALGYYVIGEMMKEGIPLDVAMTKVLNNPKMSYLRSAESDVRKLLTAGKASEIIRLANDKWSPKNQKASIEDGLTKKAQNAWEVFGIKEDVGDMDKLTEVMDKRLSSISPFSEPTRVEARKESFERAIRNYSTEGRVVVVSFANGDAIIPGATQEGELLKAIPELQNSLQKCISKHSKKYLSIYNSPEVGLYSEGLKLGGDNIKVDVISSAAIDFSTGYENNRFVKSHDLEDKDPYDEVRRRIKTQLAMAIAKGNEILITGLFGCGSYEADRNRISSIYMEELNNPLFKNKLRKVVLVYGDDDPYKG